MFSGEKPEQKFELTFKERVGLFWRNFSQVSGRLLANVKERRGEELDAETSALVFALSPSLAWVYGPGRTSEERSLTVSPEGCAHRRLLTQYWVDQAPVVPGWDFFPSRQPSEDVSGFRIEIAGQAYTPLQFWVTPEIDDDNEVVHMAAWSPAFLSLKSKDRWQIPFLWLDEVPGEDHVSNRLGKIDIRDDALGPSLPLTELKSYIEETEIRQGWKTFGPGSFTDYSFKQQSDEYPRADMIVGHTSQRLLWRDYIEAEGKIDDPWRDRGRPITSCGSRSRRSRTAIPPTSASAWKSFSRRNWKPTPTASASAGAGEPGSATSICCFSTALAASGTFSRSFATTERSKRRPFIASPETHPRRSPRYEIRRRTGGLLADFPGERASKSGDRVRNGSNLGCQ